MGPFLTVAGMLALLWIAIARIGFVGNLMASVVFMAIMGAAGVQIARGRLVAAAMLLGYLAVVQPGIRLYAKELPYLATEYSLVLLGVLLLARLRGRLRTTAPWLAYGAYFLIDAMDVVRADAMVYARAVAVPSFALFFVLVFGAQLRLGRADLRRVVNALVLGALSLGALIVNGYLTGEAVQWSRQSNFGASGGMGPNQLTLILAVVAFLCFTQADLVGKVRGLAYWAIGGVLALLMVLTFSRGGFYILAGALVLFYGVFQGFTLRSIARTLGLAMVALLIFNVALDVTGGALAVRYGELNTSNRTDLMRYGFEIFATNLPFGVGTGNFYTTISSQEYFGIESGAHNELTRAAAEHGVLGLVCWLLFVLAAVVHAARGGENRWERAFRVVLVMVAMVTLGYNGLKLFFQPMIFLLALSAFTPRARRSGAGPARRPAAPAGWAPRPAPVPR
jgi:hypothetical protein